ncbi:MAG: hypothetical protein K6G84_12920 [Lachnospiraceae bacterium]|nr:hypothetical protein [Lachnospiraceae bacterium]
MILSEEVFLDETAQVLGMGNYNMFSFDNVYGLQEKVILGKTGGISDE